VVAGDHVFVGSCSGSFFALRRDSGEPSWSYDTAADGPQAQFHGDPVVAGDLVLTGCDSADPSHAYAFERRTGKLLWKQDRPALRSDLLHIGSDVVGRTWNGDLVALDLRSGALRWTVRPENYYFEVGLDDSPIAFHGLVYFGAADGAMHAVEGTSGRVLWRRDLGCRLSATPAVDDSTVYCGCSNGRFYRLSRSDGRVLAEFDCGARPIGRMAVSGDRLVTLLGEDTIAGLSTGLDRIVWRQESGLRWSSFQPLVRGDEVIAGDSAGNVIAFKLADGSRSWETRVDGMIRGLGAHDDVLYIGTFQGTLYAYSLARP
jgi:outer membrane protein assembly factor BamB